MAELTYNFEVRKDDMISETQRFLNEFKRFEAALRNNGTAESVLDYENTLQNSNDDIYDRLRLSRQTRNYLAHHPDNFTAPTPQMTKFISQLADKEEAKSKKVKDVMTRQKAVTLSTPLKDIISTVTKSKYSWTAVVSDKKDSQNALIGILDESDVLSLIAKKGTLTGKLSTVIDEKSLKRLIRGKNIGIAGPDDRAEDIYKGFDKIVVCKDGIYKGIVK